MLLRKKAMHIHFQLPLTNLHVKNIVYIVIFSVTFYIVHQTALCISWSKIIRYKRKFWQLYLLLSLKWLFYPPLVCKGHSGPPNEHKKTISTSRLPKIKIRKNVALEQKTNRKEMVSFRDGSTKMYLLYFNLVIRTSSRVWKAVTANNFESLWDDVYLKKEANHFHISYLFLIKLTNQLGK